MDDGNVVEAVAKAEIRQPGYLLPLKSRKRDQQQVSSGVDAANPSRVKGGAWSKAPRSGSGGTPSTPQTMKSESDVVHAVGDVVVAYRDDQPDKDPVDRWELGTIDSIETVEAAEGEGGEIAYSLTSNPL